MHWVCFHYEFEHDPPEAGLDVDEPCSDVNCPSRFVTAGALAAPSALEPGQFLRLGATFIESRGGRAIVRLANGSKTTLDFDGLVVGAGPVDFVRNTNGIGERAYCQCGWETDAPTRLEAEERFRTHSSQDHNGKPPDQ